MLIAGNASERDRLAADTDLAEAEQAAAKASNGVALAEASLARLLGMPKWDGDQKLVTVSQNSNSVNWETIASIAERDHPQIQLLKKQIEIARSGGRLAATQDQPTLSARATAAAQTQTAFTDSHYLAASLVLTWKPFDRWKTRLDVAQAHSQASRLEALLDDAKSGIRLGVQKAWRDVDDARRRHSTAERQVKSSSEVLRVSRLRYEVGMASQVEVSGALFALVRSESNLVQASTDILLAENELQFTSTGSLQKDAPNPSSSRSNP